MKNAKKLSILLLALSTTYVRPESESMTDRITYAQETNNKFIYDKKVDRKALNGQEVDESVDIKIAKHRFDAGITRTKTQVKVEGNEIVTTVETWITNNPSRLTATNIALGGAAALGVAGGLGYLAYQNQDQIKEGLDKLSDRAQNAYADASQGLNSRYNDLRDYAAPQYDSARNYLSERYNALRSRFGAQQPAAGEEAASLQDVEQMNDSLSEISSEGGAAMDSADAASL